MFKPVSFLALCLLPPIALTFSQSDSDDEAWLDSLLGSGGEESAEEGIPAEVPSLYDEFPELFGWEFNSSISSGVGWRDNPLYDATSTQDAVFAFAEVDALLMRPGLDERMEYVTLFYGDFRAYDGIEGLSGESFLILRSSAGRRMGNGLKATGALGFTRSTQAFNAAESDFETDVLMVSVSKPRVDLELERWFEGIGELRFDARHGRSLNSEEGQDFDETEAVLSLSRPISDLWEMAFEFERVWEGYDDRLSRDVADSLVDAPLLDTTTDRLEASFVYARDDGALRKTTTAFAYESEDDEVGDYYERSRWILSETLRFSLGKGRLDARLRYTETDYKHRLAGGEDASERRADRSFSTTLAAFYPLRESVELFARFEYAEKRSNVEFFSYETQGLSVGISWNDVIGQ